MPRSASTRARIRIGCSMPGYSGYDSMRSKLVSARTRSTSNSGTKTAISPAALCAKATGRSVDEEPEAREVLDVVLVEEHVAGAAASRGTCSSSALAPLLQLGRRDARPRFVR